MSVVRCRCGVLIEWLTTGGGKRAPFHHQLLRIDQAPTDTAWTVVTLTKKGERKAVVVPLDNVHGRIRAAIRFVLTRHECPLREVKQRR